MCYTAPLADDWGTCGEVRARHSYSTRSRLCRDLYMVTIKRSEKTHRTVLSLVRHQHRFLSTRATAFRSSSDPTGRWMVRVLERPAVAERCL